jgi:hypothetical protein
MTAVIKNDNSPAVRRGSTGIPLEVEAKEARVE